MEIVMNSLMIYPKDLGKALEEAHNNAEIKHICHVNTGEIIVSMQFYKQKDGQDKVLGGEFTQYGYELLVSQLKGAEV